MSRVLIWSPNYAPELTGIAPLVTDAAEWLATRGHAVDVVTPMPNYPQRRIFDGYRGRLWATEPLGGVQVHRGWLRVRPAESFIDKALYELSSVATGIPRVLRGRSHADVIVCVVPTVLSAAFVTALPRGVRTVLWVQDLVIGAAAALDLTWPARKLVAAASSIERRAAKRADQIIVCSPGFQTHYERAGVNGSRIEVLFNWADIEYEPPPCDRATKAGAPAKFLYAGNLGYTQGFETLIEAAKLAGPDIAVRIVGAGNAAQHVWTLAEEVANVRVEPPTPREGYPRLLAVHDAHIVIQRKVGAGVNLPSKIATSLASGRPIVASIDPDTPAAEVLRASGGAILVEPEDPAALSNAMQLLAADSGLRRTLGEKARRYAQQHFNKETALTRLEGLLFSSSNA